MNENYNYKKESLEKYLTELSSKTIAPGGGSAAALVGALGAGLNLMVLRYSVKKERSELSPELLLVTITEQEESMKKLTSLIEEDCRVFAALMKKISGGGDKQAELKTATEVPLMIAIECHTSMDITRFLLENGNKNLLTDVACAAHLLRSAFDSAGYEVKINLKDIIDESYKKETLNTLNKLGQFIHESEIEISQKVNEYLEGK